MVGRHESLGAGCPPVSWGPGQRCPLVLSNGWGCSALYRNELPCKTFFDTQRVECIRTSSSR